MESGPLTPCGDCRLKDDDLRDAQRRLGRLQEDILRLREEYRLEAEELRQQVSRTFERVDDGDLEVSRLRTELRRRTAAKDALEAYLQTLPAQDEFKEIKEKLHRAEEEISRLGRLRVEAENAKTLKAEKEALKRENEELRLKVAAFEEDATARRRRIARGANEEDKENSLTLADDLREENAKLNKFVVIATKTRQRDVKTIDELNGRLRDLSLKVEDARSELETEKSTNRFLREDLTKTIAAGNALQRQTDALKRETLEVGDLERHYEKLSSETSRCLADLAALSSSASQMLRGHEPDISALLGIHDRETSFEKSSSESESRLDCVLRQIEQVRNVRKEIVVIRDAVSEQYAENLGNRMCITQ